jgi:hypothetical protein
VIWKTLVDETFPDAFRNGRQIVWFDVQRS